MHKSMGIEAQILPSSDAETEVLEGYPSRSEVEAQEILRSRMFRRMRDWRLGAADLGLLLCMLMQLGVARTLHRLGWNLQAALAQTVALADLVLVFSCVVLWIPLLWVSGLYRQYRWRSIVLRSLLASALLTTALAVCCLAFRPDTALKAVLPLFSLGCLIVLAGTRMSLVLWSRTGLRELRMKRVVLIIGSGRLAEKLAWNLQHSQSTQYDILGFIDNEPQQEDMSRLGQHLGNLDEIEDFLMTNIVDEVHIALPVKSHYEEIQEAVRLCELSGIDPHYPADLFRTEVAKRVQSEEGRVVLRMTHSDSRLLLKRALDVVASALGLVLLSPLFLVIAMMVKFTSPGPVFFRQPRYGLNKRRFGMLKFRSMVVDAERQMAAIEHMNEAGGPIFKIARDPRITRVGALLRKTSMDELPQLWNVLRGQMSLVGPRPMSLRDVKLFSELALMRRFSVPPGMTGLWQVSGRSSISFDQWIELDLKYIDEWSLKLDLWILMETLPAVIKGRGAS